MAEGVRRDRARRGIGVLVVMGLALSGWLAYATTIPAGGSYPTANTVHCTLTGKATFKPGLKTGGTAASVAIAFSGKLSACSGTGTGANVTGGTVKATGTGTSNNCTTLATTSLPTITATTKWKVKKKTPKLADTTTKFTSGSVTIGTNITVALSGSATGGAFSGDSASATAVTDQTASQFATACGSKKGLSSFTFKAVGPSSVSLS